MVYESFDSENGPVHAENQTLEVPSLGCRLESAFWRSTHCSPRAVHIYGFLSTNPGMDAFRKPEDITHLRIPRIGTVRGRADETVCVQFKLTTSGSYDLWKQI